MKKKMRFCMKEVHDNRHADNTSSKNCCVKIVAVDFFGPVVTLVFCSGQIEDLDCFLY